MNDSKREQYLKKYGGELASSLGQGRAPGVPAGMTQPTSGLPAKAVGVGRDAGAHAIEIGRIAPDPEQPRRSFDEEALDRLAASLKQRGQLQNIVVFWSEDLGSYVIISGERRYRAAQRAGLPTLRCKILERRPDDQERLGLQLIENCVREDLAPIERARAFRRLLDATGWSHERLGEELHITQFTVSTALKLLELPEAVQARVEAGELAPRVAYEVSKLGEAEAQVTLAERIVADGLTRDEVVAEVQAIKAERPRGRGASSGQTAKGKARSRGPRLATKRVFKAAGARATIERAKGIDSDVLRAIAQEILASLVEDGGARASDSPDSDRTGSRAESAGPREGDDEQGRGVAA
jgi:ParB family chromosome partitioning protein